MEKTNENIRKRKKNRSLLTLRILTSIYALLYILFIYDYFIPGENFDPWNTENTYVKMLFFIFVVGYIISWKSELAAGVIFLSWYAAMWYLELILVPHGGGGGIVMGFPLFLLAIFFIAAWYNKKRNRNEKKGISQH